MAERDPAGLTGSAAPPWQLWAFHNLAKGVEPGAPERPLQLRESFQPLEAGGIDHAPPLAAHFTAADQLRCLEHPDVLAKARQGDS